MTEFMLALQFLTIIPVKVKFSVKKFAGALVFFPVVGLFLGLVLAGANMFMAKSGFDALLSSAVTVILLIVLTGGLHMDGLADTADALAGGKSREEQLRIMRDPHIGSMGALALVCVIVLETALLNVIPSQARTAALILMCVLGRWNMVFVMHGFTYARKNGRAKVFMQGLNFKIVFFTGLLTLAIAFMVSGLKGPVVMLLAAVAAYITGRLAGNKTGGITGDIIGATDEFTEVLVLFVVYISGMSGI